jgi:hypothetical protein
MSADNCVVLDARGCNTSQTVTFLPFPEQKQCLFTNVVFPKEKPSLKQKEIVHQCFGYPNRLNLPTNHHLLVCAVHAAVLQVVPDTSSMRAVNLTPSELLSSFYTRI